MSGLAKALVAVGMASTVEACNRTLVKGKISMRDDQHGEEQVYFGGHDGDMHKGVLTVRHDAGFTAFSECVDEWEPESIRRFQLLGKRMSFDVDLSRVGCACNLAFYLIGSPARGEDGEYVRGDEIGGMPPYYCDANKVGGQWCPEIDIMEANARVLQASAHVCDKPVNGHYSSCDRSGCFDSTDLHENLYGPGGDYTIDTRKAFTVHTDFLESTPGKLTGMITTLVQGQNSVVLDHGKCKLEYLASLSDVLRDGMSLRITYWGSDAQTMDWLDRPVCDNLPKNETQCKGDNAGDALMSNISVVDVPKASSTSAPAQSWNNVWEQPAASQPWQPATTKQQWQPWQPATTKQQWQPWEPATTTTPQVQPWQPPTTTVPPVWTEQWVSDIYQPWQCHVYSDPRVEMEMWCVTAGFQDDGYEYQYNGGIEGPCGDCSCCKRKARRAWETQTTTPALTPELAWIVVDQKDEHFGEEVPHEILHDGSHFKSLGQQGVAQWEEKLRFVKMVSREEKEKLLDHGKYAHINMQKFELNGEGLSNAVAARRWLTVSGLPGCLLIALVVLAAAGVGFRRWRGHALTSPPVPGAAVQNAISPSVGEAPATLSTFGSPLRLARSGGHPLLRASASPSSSSQNLLRTFNIPQTGSAQDLEAMGEEMA